MPILANISCDVDPQPLMKRAHIAPGSADAADFERLVQTACAAGRPKAAYREAFIDAKGEQTVSIEGITFTSRMLRKNLEHAERVFAYLVTCGRELDEIAPSSDDLLTAFWWDLIKGEFLAIAVRHLTEHLDRKHLLPQTSTMHPGSGDAAVWPIEQQRELFALLGDVPDQIGVELTDTCLMIPNKTVSGIRFPTETSFRSCQVCRRPACPNRAAAFDEALWASVWHE
ncbi:MAG TPA: vitamin B12 dependent-methionine synthase activation domain-containing protein [Candidatus Anammoximicrobium sp.]|nr:vitamin B12 dependent-methionine synthase activation domain-containing protein [Candidatus Anammoximicrobium sp.]